MSRILGKSQIGPLAVRTFVHAQTGTATHLLLHTPSGSAALIDPAMDYDLREGTLSSGSADSLVELIERSGHQLRLILDTHVHADHVSAASHLAQVTGARTVAGAGIRTTVGHWRNRFPEPAIPYSEAYDILAGEGDSLPFGPTTIQALATPGHSPCSTSYVVPGAAFVGDTLLSTCLGSARADFPGGDARELFRSARRILALPSYTRIFVGHLYGTDSGALRVVEHRAQNPHFRDGISEDDFVQLRHERDAQLELPRLIYPSVQLNLTAGRPPPAASGGRSFASIPLHAP